MTAQSTTPASVYIVTWHDPSISHTRNAGIYNVHADGWTARREAERMTVATGKPYVAAEYVIDNRKDNQ